MGHGYENRDRYGREERGRSWFGGNDDARGRPEAEPWRAEDRPRRDSRDDRWRSGAPWGSERSYSSGREYGDREYGWPGEYRGQARRPMPDRDYGWRAEPPAARFTGTSSGPYEPPDYSGYVASGRQGYGGPYARDRHAAREWSSTEGWRVAGPFAGRGPRGYQRSDQRIDEDLHERLTAHGLIDATDIECRVASGEVTLTGFVNSREARRAAEDVAEDTYGVRQVDNQLRIRSHADDDGVGRTSVLGLTESQTQTRHSPADPAAGPERQRTRS